MQEHMYKGQTQQNELDLRLSKIQDTTTKQRRSAANARTHVQSQS